MNRFKEVTGKEPEAFDIFYAGYIFANPSVRDLIKEQKIKEKYDGRISNIIWR